ncbi:MAG: JAB domain-containing protein [Desulfobacterales bacterium]|nr:JAB domain-containing protein [Desulfobacterales bacterium]
MLGLLGSAAEKTIGVGAGLRDWGMKGYQRNMAEAQENAATVSFKDLADDFTLGKFGTWLTETGGSLVPSMVEAAVGVATGTGLAGIALKKGIAKGSQKYLTESVLKKSIEKTLEKGIATEAGKKLVSEVGKAEAKKQLRDEVTKGVIKRFGGQVGMGAAVLPMEAGGNYGQLMDEHGVDAPFSSLATGTVSTALEYLGGNIGWLDKVIPGAGGKIMRAISSKNGNLLKRTAKEIATSMPAEMGQEAGQGLMSILNTVANTDEKLFTEKNMWEVLENAAAGGVGGGFGGVAQGLTSSRQTAEPKIDPVQPATEPVPLRPSGSTASSPTGKLFSLNAIARKIANEDAGIRPRSEIAEYGQASGELGLEPNMPNAPGQFGYPEIEGQQNKAMPQRPTAFKAMPQRPTAFHGEVDRLAQMPTPAFIQDARAKIDLEEEQAGYRDRRSEDRMTVEKLRDIKLTAIDAARRLNIAKIPYRNTQLTEQETAELEQIIKAAEQAEADFLRAPGSQTPHEEQNRGFAQDILNPLKRAGSWEMPTVEMSTIGQAQPGLLNTLQTAPNQGATIPMSPSAPQAPYDPLIDEARPSVVEMPLEEPAQTQQPVKAEPTQTKKQKAEADYNTFVGTLSDEQIQSVKGLIVENPSSPGSQKLKIQKALAKVKTKPSVEERFTKAISALQTKEGKVDLKKLHAKAFIPKEDFTRLVSTLTAEGKIVSVDKNTVTYQPEGSKPADTKALQADSLRGSTLDDQGAGKVVGRVENAVEAEITPKTEPATKAPEKSSDPWEMTREEILQEAMAHNEAFLGGGLSSEEFSSRGERKSLLRKEWAKRFEDESLDEAAKKYAPVRRVKEIQKDIAALQKRIDKINENRKAPLSGGTRAKTTTANANAGKLIDNLKVLKQELLEAENQLKSDQPSDDRQAKKIDQQPMLNSLNPTGGIFEGYTPQVRMTAKLGDNITTLDKTSGKSPDEMITIYRGAPKTQKSINAGDYVTTNLQLAKDYGGGKVISLKVKMSDVLDDRTEPLGEEYIYRPVSAKTETAETPSAKPGKITTLPTESLSVDPERFQYKRYMGQGGAGSKLREVKKYNPELGGIISVWKDPADGKTYVVNGHHRYELASRAGYPELVVRYLDAKTAEQAKLKGALINIAEGQGSPEDAAVVFRKSDMTPEKLQQKYGVSVKGEIAKQGMGLSQLDESIFKKVEVGDLPRAWGVIIGEKLPDHEAQKALVQLLEKESKRRKNISTSLIEQLINDVAGVETKAEVQASLFGDVIKTRPLLMERAELRDYAIKTLSADKRLFGVAGDSSKGKRLQQAGNRLNLKKNKQISENAGKTADIINRLSGHKGPVSDALNQHAKELSDAKSISEKNAVKSRFLEAVRGAAEMEIGGRTGRVSEGNNRYDRGREFDSGTPEGLAEPIDLFGNTAPGQQNLFGDESGKQQKPKQASARRGGKQPLRQKQRSLFVEPAEAIQPELFPAFFEKRKPVFKPAPVPRNLQAPGRTRMATTGYIGHNSLVAKNAAEVASLLAHIRKSAQEHVFTVTTDKNGTILEIHRYSKGLRNSSQISPIELAGHVLNVPGASKTYFVHNHPSENPKPSNEDVSMVDKIGHILKTRDIELEALVIAGQKYRDITSWMNNSDEAIPPNARTVKLPVKERFLVSKKNNISINNPDKATAAFQKHEAKDGILFLDSQLHEVGFMPWPAGESKKTATGDIIAALEKANAHTYILKSDKPLTSTDRGAYVENLIADLRVMGINPLDIVEQGISFQDSGRIDFIGRERNANFDGLLSEDILYSYVGQKSKTADKSALAQAVEMEQAGEDMEAIRQETGWFLGMDDFWRYEIDDSKMKIDFGIKPHGGYAIGVGLEAKRQKLDRPLKLPDILEHKELFKAYPFLSDVGVSDRQMTDRSGEWNEKGNGIIWLNTDLHYYENAEAVLLHEIQHAIQGYEGFASGGSPEEAYQGTERADYIQETFKRLRKNPGNKEYSDSEVRKHAEKIVDSEHGRMKHYKHLAGEIESRDTSARMGLTAEQRKQTAPYSSQGISKQDAIIKFKSDGTSMSTQLTAAITKAAIKSMPIAKTWKITEKDGKLYIQTRKGYGFTIEAVDSVTENKIAFRAGYGRAKRADEVIEGAYQHDNRSISIVKGVGDKWTVGHEFTHFLEKSGILSPFDVKALEQRIKALTKQGKFKPESETNIGGEEDRARFVASALYDRGQPGVIRNIMRRIADIIDGFVNLFKRTSRGVIRDIESGRIMDSKGGVAVGGTAVAYQVSGWHGSPNDITKSKEGKFSTNHIGEGEGNQAFGWGLYYTESEAVARGYADTLGGNKYYFDNKELKAIVRKYIPGATTSDVAQIASVFKDGIPRKHIAYRSTAARQALSNAEINKMADEIEALPGARNLYKVTINKGKQESEYTFLDWDKPFPADKIDAVKSELQKADLPPEMHGVWTSKSFNTGRAIYHKITGLFMDGETSETEAEKQASLLLLRAGIDGIRYPVGSLSGMKSDKHNYVVFDENAVTVEEHIQYSTRNITPALSLLSDLKAKHPSSRVIQIVQGHIDNGGMRYLKRDVQEGAFDGLLRPEEIKILTSVADSDKDLAKYRAMDPVQYSVRALEKERMGEDKIGWWDMVKGIFTDTADRYQEGKTDFSAASKIFSPPLHHFDKIEAGGRMYKHTVGSKDDFYLKTDEMFADGQGGSYYGDMEALAKANPKEFKKLNQRWVDDDMNGNGYGMRYSDGKWRVFGKNKKQVAEFDSEEEAHSFRRGKELEDLREEGYSEDAIKVHAGKNTILDRGFETLMKPMRDLIARAKEELAEKHLGVKKGVNGKWVVYNTMNGQLQGGSFDSEAEAWDSVLDMPAVIEEDKTTGQKRVGFSVALAQMGDLRGHYFPRVRKSGAYVLTATKKGANTERHHFDIPAGVKIGNRMINLPAPMQIKTRQLEAKGYKVTWKKSESMPESIFDLIGQRLGFFEMISKGLEGVGVDAISTLRDMGLQGKWVDKEDSRDYILTGESAYRERYLDIFQEFGGKFRYVERHIRNGKIGYGEWTFEDAKGDIEQKIAQRIFEVEAINPDFVAKFQTEIATQIGNIFKARGARSHMIQRSEATGKDVVIGYETDAIQSIGQYIRGIAAGEAKRDLAINLIKDFTGTWESWTEYKERAGEGADWNDYKELCNERRIDPTRQKNAHNELLTFMKDVLRNQEQVDRIVGTMTGAAVLKYLAGRVAAPLVNLTALPTALVGTMHGIANVPFAKSFANITRAIKFYRTYRWGDKETLPADIKRLFEDIDKKGWLVAQYDREALTVLHSKVGRGYNKLIDLGMSMFAVTEQINRAASIAGTYLSVKDQMGHDEALELSKEVSDKANGEYSKGNRMHWTRGGGLAANS